MYPVCVLAAERIFDKSQFLFLRYEDLTRMRTSALLDVLSRFVGLDGTSPELLQSLEAGGQCAPEGSDSKPMSFTDHENKTSAAQFERVVKEFGSFFDNYNVLLEELVGPGFTWKSSEHGPVV